MCGHPLLLEDAALCIVHYSPLDRWMRLSHARVTTHILVHIWKHIRHHRQRHHNRMSHHSALQALSNTDTTCIFDTTTDKAEEH